jgi:hypothetical protein
LDRPENVDRDRRRWPSDMYHRDRYRMNRGREQERDDYRRTRRNRDERIHSQRERSRSPRVSLRNGGGSARYPQSPERSHRRRRDEDR